MEAPQSHEHPAQNRAAARDELLAQHHYEETVTIDTLLKQNTELTQQVHELTQKVHKLTEHLCSTSGIGRDAHADDAMAFFEFVGGLITRVRVLHQHGRSNS